ncbi:Homeobox-leucine zipper protein ANTHOCYANINLESS 2 [Apostasia shenzhenica]|uniref:Homeobox-leucine zipper protein ANTHOCYANINLESS 2 n=1 Tax=Apostasia shenzhenica TaxID=1088818 RepID=A0A2I0AF84_9ASPA|nr:Homeobox-leucine zipper protein ANTHOCYANINLESS 2 [Apostasia shenzhenica]
MSFGGHFDDDYGSSGVPITAAPSPIFGSASLSLGLSNVEGHGELNRLTAAGGCSGGELDGIWRNKEEEDESRSGSDNFEAGSGDDLDLENPRKKKRYHRHTPQQIQELEALFKECPHPDEKQRQELSLRLRLENRQVKFWFQNRRTQMKTQLERHENTILRQEHEKLRAENITIRDLMRNPICGSCGGPAVLGEVPLEEQQLRIENARLKDELDRVCAIAGKFLGRPISSLPLPISYPLPNSSLDLAVGGNGAAFGAFSSVATAFPAVSDLGTSPLGTVITPSRSTLAMDRSLESSMFLELALTAMDELVKLSQTGEPIWARWADLFPGMIARSTTTDVISTGVGGSRNGALQLMQAELQVLSPLVPIREVVFLRFCKQLADGAWAVVDVSVDGNRDNPAADSVLGSKCRRLPSGCVVQDMPNGYSKVTWVEHAEYNDAAVHQIFRPLLRSGMALGAQRWVATLHRHCECLAILMSSSVPNRGLSAITAAGRRSMLRLAHRMTENFCAGVCASAEGKWTRLANMARSVGEDVRVMTRQSAEDPGEPPGVVLSAATSVWLPASPHRLFEFLHDESQRSQWDILSNGGPMLEMAHIAKGQNHGNAVSLLRCELEPKRHPDTARDVHRRLGLDGGVRAGGCAGDAARHERRRLRLRGAAAVGLRRHAGWVGSGGRGEGRAGLAADGGVPDSGQQPADGEADHGVGGDGEQSDILHRAEDQGGSPVRELIRERRRWRWRWRWRWRRGG